MSNESIPRSKRIQIGIKWKMFAILIIFISIMVAVMWMIQVQMTSYFYQQIRFNEMQTTAVSIEGNLENLRRAGDTMDQCAETYDLNIWLFSVENNTLHEIKYTSDSVHEMTYMPRIMSQLYDSAENNHGIYVAMLSAFNPNTSGNVEILADNSEDPEAIPTVRSIERCDAYYTTILRSGGRLYFLVQNANMTPLPATVTMMENLFLFTGVFVLILALILAFVLARLITKPIVQMNAAAKKLAQGEYNTEFAGRGYREIDELAQTLNYASYELSKTDRLQKELISNVSHDLRTPLTMIRGYSEVMRDIPGENTPENVQVIIDETTRLSELVNDLLDLSRIQSGTRHAEFVEFSLTDMVRNVMSRYEKLTEQQGCRITFEANQNVWVRADRGMILQVLYNLINNAINYTGEDRVVAVRQYTADGHVCVCVTDTGEGITEAEIPLIWDRYYKVDRVHRRAMVGTGLGLSIVKEVLEIHHASYGVQSTPGQGSTFWFELNTISTQYELQNGDGKQE